MVEVAGPEGPIMVHHPWSKEDIQKAASDKRSYNKKVRQTYTHVSMKVPANTDTSSDLLTHDRHLKIFRTKCKTSYRRFWEIWKWNIQTLSNLYTLSLSPTTTLKKSLTIRVKCYDLDGITLKHSFLVTSVQIAWFGSKLRKMQPQHSCMPMSGDCQLLFLQAAFSQKHAQVWLCHQHFSCRLTVYIAQHTVLKYQG